MSEKTYKLIRFFENHPRQVLKTGLTLEEVQEHCQDPETSSRGCTSKEGIERTRVFGNWFDGYEVE